jgi:hypothetical protein
MISNYLIMISVSNICAMVFHDETRTLNITKLIFLQPPRSKNPTANPIGSNQPTKSDRIPGCGPTFGSLVLESDGILVSEFEGTYRWVLTDLYC